MELRPYQTEMLAAIAEHLGRGLNRLLCKAPTGTGKTVTFAALLKHLEPWLSQFRTGDRKMLVIAHREELLDQAAAKIQSANPGLVVMVEQGERRASVHADVVVASIQTLSAMKFRRLHRFLARTRFRVVVVDEAHHAAASTYRTALVHLGFLPPADASDKNEIEAATHDDVVAMRAALEGWDAVAPKDRVLVGVTATPNRSDSVGLGCVFQTLAYSYDLRAAIGDGWLVPIEALAVQTKTSLEGIKTVRGDWQQKALEQAINNEARNRLGVAAWLEHAKGLPTIAFTAGVAHAEALANAFRAQGVRAEALSGETPKDERRRMLDRYRDRQTEVVCNCMVLTEGTDLPLTEVILHARPTQSATLYEQMTGRGLRLWPGKSRCVVLDLVDSTRHGLQAAPVLYGLPPSILAAKQELSAMAKRYDEILEGKPGFDPAAALNGSRMTLEQLGALAKSVNVWQRQELGAFGAGRKMNWIRNGDIYRVSYPWLDGQEAITVEPDLVGRWEVSLTLSTREGRRQRTIAREVESLDKAGEIAESFIAQERKPAVRVAGKDAGWRSDKASEAQLGLLKKWRVQVKPGMTKGEASDLITVTKAQRGFR